MSLKDTYKQIRDLLIQITNDLDKAEGGNKAASQRVRTGTVKLEKIAKLYRKESIVSEKKNKGQKKPSKTTAKLATKTSSKASTSKTRSTTAQSSGLGASSKPSSKVKAKPKAKTARSSVRPQQLSIKRATAKLPTRRVSAS